jgi:hypothetical protein
MRGDVRDDVQPREASRRRVLREVAQHEVERDEDGELEDERETRGGGIDLVLAVEGHQLLLLALLVRLVLLLDRLHLRHVLLHPLHRMDLPHHQRDEQHPDDHRQRDDRPRPRQADGRVQPVEDVPEDVLERRERRRHDHANILWSSA